MTQSGHLLSHIWLELPVARLPLSRALIGFSKRPRGFLSKLHVIAS
jgi:hypothetical protein